MADTVTKEPVPLNKQKSMPSRQNVTTEQVLAWMDAGGSEGLLESHFPCSNCTFICAF